MRTPATSVSALAAFEDALWPGERIGESGQPPRRAVVGRLGAAQPRPHRRARWRVQRALKAELIAVGEEDPYVDEELALLEGSAGSDLVGVGAPR